jgi:hypothetical protein
VTALPFHPLVTQKPPAIADVKGLAERLLVLNISKQPSELDDGFLTRSKVAQLRLNGRSLRKQRPG